MTVALNPRAQQTKEQADRALDSLLDVLTRTSEVAQQMLDNNKRRNRQEGNDEPAG